MKVSIALIVVAVGLACVSLPARAAETLVMKSGETVNLSAVWWIANCRSLLKGPMTVEILDGPPEITAAIHEQDVVAHTSNCANPVKGGMLTLTAAKDIKDKIHAEVVLRVKFPTQDGDRQKSFDLDAIVVP
jgi:hypothetical protein